MPKIPDYFEGVTRQQIFDIKYQKLCWHPRKSLLLCAFNDSTKVHITFYHIAFNGLFSPVEECQVPVSPASGKLMQVSLHPTNPWVLIVCQWELLIWGYESRKVEYQLQMERDNEELKDEEENPEQKYLLGGNFFPEKTSVCVLINGLSGCANWGIWTFTNFKENSIITRELEDHNMYRRGAVLHPSGELIGALWNAHCCGYLIHGTDPRAQCQICDSIGRKHAGYMEYYLQPRVDREEYEAFLPAFNPAGTHFAFCVNPYVMDGENLGIVCAYEIMTGKLLFEYPTRTQFEEKQLEYGDGGEVLTLTTTHSFVIIDAQKGLSTGQRNFQGSIIHSSSHPLLKSFAILFEEGNSRNLEIILSKTGNNEFLLGEQQTNYKEAKNLATIFKETYQKNLIPVSMSNLSGCATRAFNKAIRDRKANRPQKAEKILRTVVEVFREHFTAWLELSNLVNRDLGMQKEGEACFLQAIQYYPSGWFHYNDLAWKYFEQGDLGRARECGEAMVRVGSVLWEQRKEEIALSEGFIRGDPRAILCYGKDLLAVILTQSEDQDDIKQAIALFEECIAIWIQIYHPLECYYSPKWYKLAHEKAGREPGVIWELENRMETDYAQAITHFKEDSNVCIQDWDESYLNGEKIDEKDSFSVIITGKSGTPYENCKIVFDIYFPRFYPRWGYSASCNTPVWHPCFDPAIREHREKSTVKLIPFLDKDQWDPAFTLVDLIKGLKGLLHLNNAYVIEENVTQREIWELFRKDRAEFDRKARAWVAPAFCQHCGHEIKQVPNYKNQDELIWHHSTDWTSGPSCHIKGCICENPEPRPS